MDYAEIKEKFPDAVGIIEMVEVMAKDLANADDTCADALTALYEGNVYKAIGILEKRAAKIITDAYMIGGEDAFKE